MKDLWLHDIPYSRINKEKLNRAVEQLDTKFPDRHVDGKGNPIWAYNLQDIFWNFLTTAEITEECFDHSIQSEIIMYNLGKFSQVLNDFEEINFNSSPPSFHLFNFRNFLQYAAKDYYPEGWMDNPYRTPRAVQIMTVHQAKGLEFPAVFIPGLNKNYLPAKKPGGLNEWHFLDASLIQNQDRYVGGIEDERRLFYVALTRAQKYLFVSRAPDATNQLYRKPSDFVQELIASDVIVSNDPAFNQLPKIAPQPKDEVISLTLNFSVLKDFFECPYRFKLVSMYGFCYPLDQRMGMGRSLHNSLMEIHKRSKLGEHLSVDRAVQIAQDQSNFPYIGSSTQLGEMKEIVKRRVADYYRKNESALGQIEYVEQEIQLNLDESILVTGKQLKTLKDNSGEAMVIHYSRQNLNDNERGMATPRIIAIMVKSLDGITTNCFAIHHEAEKAKVILENIEDYYDLLEGRLLTGFNYFVKSNPGRKWIHWDMNDVHFSFEAIEHRYKVLVDELGRDFVQVPYNDRINLNQLIKAIYSSNYENDPQLDNLMRTNNNGQLREGFLTLPQEAQQFKQLGFPSFLESLRFKVNFLLDVIEKAANDTLKVGKRNPINRLKAFITHPVTATISIFLTLASLVIKFLGIVGK